jgi:putative transposase
MARISRVVASGYPHHVTQRGVRSIPIFQTDSDRWAHLDFMTAELSRFGIEVLAWCLMTNHPHLIVVPNDATVLSRAVGEAHRGYTRMKNFSDGVRGYLFQGRFGSCVLDERDLLAAARYVELNPVNAEMVSEAGDYPWSSARFHLGINTRDALARDKTLLGLIEDWTEYLKGNDEPRIQRTLQRGIRTGRPAGSEQFIEMIEGLTGRDLRMRKAGRPLKRAS